MITKVYQDPMKGTARPCPVLFSQPSCIANSSTVSLSTMAPSSEKPITPSTSTLSTVRPKTSSGHSPSKSTLDPASGLGLTNYTVNSATVRPKTSSGLKKPIHLTISTSAANKLERPKTSSGPTSTSRKANLVISTASVNPIRHKYILSQSATSSPIDPIDRLKSITATSTPSTITSHNLYPYYPPTSSIESFHTLHSRSSSASSIRSAASVSSASSASSASTTSSAGSSVLSTSSVLKPNSLTKDYLFYLKSDHIADQWAGMRMLSQDEEWEEWGRGLRGVLEPRIVGMDCGWTPIGEILGQ